MTPIPCLPASVMPDGLICEATANGISSCSGSSCSAASCSVNQSLSSVTRSPRISRRMTPIASSWRSRCTIGSMPSVCASEASAPGPGAEDRPPAGHVVELHHALRDVERVVIGQRDDAGGELDALRCARPPRRGTSRARRSSPSRSNGARRTRIRRSRAGRGARRGRDRGGTAASDARRSDDAGRGRRRSEDGA